MSEILSWVNDPDRVAEVRPVMRVNRKAWFIRLYLWIWRPDPTKINSCKLWWLLVVLGVPALIVRVVTLPIVILVVKVIEPGWDRLRVWKEARRDQIDQMDIDEVRRETKERKEREEAEEEERRRRRRARRELRDARRARRQKRREVVFGRVAVGGDRAVGFFHLIWAGLKWIWPVVKYPIFALGMIAGLLAALGAGWLVYQAILVAPWTFFLEMLLAGVAVVVIFFGGMLFATSDPGQAMRSGVKEGTTGFFQVIGRSAKATHHRTCAVVEVVDE